MNAISNEQEKLEFNQSHPPVHCKTEREDEDEFDDDGLQELTQFQPFEEVHQNYSVKEEHTDVTVKEEPLDLTDGGDRASKHRLRAKKKVKLSNGLQFRNGRTLSSGAFSEMKKLRDEIEMPGKGKQVNFAPAIQVNLANLVSSNNSDVEALLDTHASSKDSEEHGEDRLKNVSDNLHIDTNELVTMSHSELNEKLKSVPKETEMKYRQLRKSLKNRISARISHLKRKKKASSPDYSEANGQESAVLKSGSSKSFTSDGSDKELNETNSNPYETFSPLENAHGDLIQNAVLSTLARIHGKPSLFSMNEKGKPMNNTGDLNDSMFHPTVLALLELSKKSAPSLSNGNIFDHDKGRNSARNYPRASSPIEFSDNSNSAPSVISEDSQDPLQPSTAHDFSSPIKFRDIVDSSPPRDKPLEPAEDEKVEDIFRDSKNSLIASLLSELPLDNSANSNKLIESLQELSKFQQSELAQGGNKAVQHVSVDKACSELIESLHEMNTLQQPDERNLEKTNTGDIRLGEDCHQLIESLHGLKKNSQTENKDDRTGVIGPFLNSPPQNLQEDCNDSRPISTSTSELEQDESFQSPSDQQSLNMIPDHNIIPRGVSRDRPTFDISDDDLMNLSVPMLNRRLKDVPPHLHLHYKHRRRTLKNRYYAKKCRRRRICLANSLETQNSQLKSELDVCEEKIGELYSMNSTLIELNRAYFLEINKLKKENETLRKNSSL